MALYDYWQGLLDDPTEAQWVIGEGGNLFTWNPDENRIGRYGPEGLTSAQYNYLSPEWDALFQEYTSAYNYWMSADQGAVSYPEYGGLAGGGLQWSEDAQPIIAHGDQYWWINPDTGQWEQTSQDIYGEAYTNPEDWAQYQAAIELYPNLADFITWSGDEWVWTSVTGYTDWLSDTLLAGRTYDELTPEEQQNYDWAMAGLGEYGLPVTVWPDYPNFGVAGANDLITDAIDRILELADMDPWEYTGLAWMVPELQSIIETGQPTWMWDGGNIEDYFQSMVYDPMMLEYGDLMDALRESYGSQGFFSSARAGAEAEATEELVTSLAASRAMLEYENELANAARQMELMPYMAEWGMETWQRDFEQIPAALAQYGGYIQAMQQAYLDWVYSQWAGTQPYANDALSQALAFLGIPATGYYGTTESSGGLFEGLF